MQARYPARGGKGKSSFAANREARKEYIREGGTYVASKRDIPDKMRDKRTEAIKKKNAQAYREEEDNTHRAFIMAKQDEIAQEMNKKFNGSFLKFLQ